MAQGFTYDPSEGIKQAFQQTSAGIGNLFTQILQQKQRDYALAEETYNNIENLKKSINIWGAKDVTNKSNALLSKAASFIKEDGKIDYSKLGEIRQEISNIKDDKIGYELGAQWYDKMMQLGIANKDNLTSFEGFATKMNKIMSTPELIRNPDGLVKAMQGAYDSSLDVAGMVAKDYAKFRPFAENSTELTNKKGDIVKVTSYLPQGWIKNAEGQVVHPITVIKGADGKPVLDPNTGKPVEMDYVAEYMSRLKASNPDLLDKIVKSNPVMSALPNGDYMATKFFIDNSIPNQKGGVSTVKTKAEQEADALKPKQIKTSIKAAEESILTNRAQRGYLQKQADLIDAKIGKINNAAAGESGLKVNTFKNAQGQTVTEMPFATPLKMDFPSIKYKGLPLGEVEVLSYYTIGNNKYAKVARKIEAGPWSTTAPQRNYIEVKLDQNSANVLNNRLQGQALGAAKEGEALFNTINSAPTQPAGGMSAADFANFK